MNWNNNDTKYILKRFIIYILIFITMFIIGTWKTKALTQSAYTWAPSDWNVYAEFSNGSDFTRVRSRDSAGNYNQPFINYGEGTIVFSIVMEHNGNSSVLRSINVGNDADIFACDIGTSIDYSDSSTQNIVFTAKCPVNFKNGNGLKFFDFNRAYTSGNLRIKLPILTTFVSKDDTSVNVNVDQQEVVNAVNNSQQATIQQIQASSNQAHQDAQQQHQDMQDINNSINNDSVTTSDADDFTNNQAFTDSTGLESVIQLPLNMVNSLTSTCQPINVTIPFIDYTGQIPCMSTIYRSKFNTLYTIVKLVINGFFVYRLLLKVYELVHNAKQPDEDKLEVIDL